MTTALSARLKSHQRRTGRMRRHARVRKRVTGIPERPRLVVFRSTRHIYAQLIDDTSGRTVASASTMEAAARSDRATGGREARGGGQTKTDAAKRVGSAIAERARAAGVTAVVFDRGGFSYHGRIAALADAAREGGLEF